MNQRIKELFKLIRKSKHTSNLMSNPPQVRYSYTIDEEDIKKFAELIVKDCIRVMHEQERIPAGFFYAKSANIHEVAIRDYFGVEE